MKVNHSLARLATQWLLFIFLTALWTKALVINDFFVNFEFCCPFGGLQAITTFIFNEALACSMGGMQVVMGALLALGCILFSRLFCSFICPIGTFTEFLGRIGKKFKIKKISFPKAVDAALRTLKYLLLFFTFYFTLQSNDLFCKTFDPFYAAATNFEHESNVLWVGIIFAILFLGSILVHQFWCRYLCPLAALSNMFKYFYVFLPLIALGFAFRYIDSPYETEILLGLACILGFAIEFIGTRKKVSAQALQIVRVDSTCIHCNLCNKTCPQGIPVAQMKQVSHPDCTMCGDCVDSCPKKKTLEINGSSLWRWTPLLITLALIITGFAIAPHLTIPTIDKNWGSNSQNARSASFEMEGLKHIKCYGSSFGFVYKMQGMRGVIGAKTYVAQHRVVVQYDTTMIDAETIRKAIFEPVNIDIKEPEPNDVVYLYRLKVENYFDQLDRVFVANTLKSKSGVFSFKTSYGHPVTLEVYGDSTLSPQLISEWIEGCNLVYKTAEKSFSSKGLYKVSEANVSDTTYTGTYIRSLKFRPFQTSFNNRSSYPDEAIGMLAIPILAYPKNKQSMQFVANYLSYHEKRIVGLRSRYTDKGPYVYVFYLKDRITPVEIKSLFAKDSIEVQYSNGKKEYMKMPYTFELNEK